MRIFTLILALLSVCFPLSAQIEVSGKITAQEADNIVELPFAAVVLKNAKDTTKIEFSTITDLKGNYSFENVPANAYLLVISHLGYDTLSEVIEVYASDSKTVLEFNYTLTADATLLDEVRITAASVYKGIDKTTYRMAAADLKNARFSMDLLETLPSLSIDPVTKKIVSAQGSVLILIDGIASSEIDLKAIPPNKVDRIEYYDIPPARYLAYSAVVNVVTKDLDAGFSAGVSLHHAFTTGFGDDDIFIKLIRGRQQFSLDYTLSYRDYSKVKDVVKYSYLIDDKPLNRNENTDRPFGYNDHYINLKYVNQLQDNYIFQAKFSPNMDFYHSKYRSEIEILTDGTETYRTGNKTDKGNTFNPSLNLYLWKQLKHRQAITIDLLGNIFKVNQNVTNQEYNKTDNLLELDDRMELENSKKTFIGELAYEKTINTGKLTFGNRLETYRMDSKVNNSFDNTDYNSSYFSDYFYADYTGRINRFMYRATLGLTYKQNKNPVNEYSSWIFRPLFLLGYNINQKHSLRLVYSQSSQEPSISEQSDNVVFVTDNILMRGNPHLKNSLNQTVRLNWRFADKWLDLNLSLVGISTKNNIASYYVKTDDFYLFTSQNDKEYKVLGLSYFGAVRPFGTNLLTLKLSGQTSKYFVTNDIIGNFEHWYTPLRYELALRVGNFVASYYGSIASKYLSGTYLGKDENVSSIVVRYTRNNFSVWGGWLWMFNPSQYNTETIPASVVQYFSDRRIYDNKNMFTLGLSYTFNRGKEYSEQQKLIDNRDTDSGLFR
ncbi:MAG: carboxypeptidase-like regulatory domain-containing protein [Prevotellaceae bacterium]|jgi:hypothetical protein|nr:carboxypeptidase-like regulatory domain-containing protein [Prevotellaceae bacterium]